jgi:hypothetical protein
VDALQAELALLAAQFVLPGLGPDVDRAIRVACDLIAGELDTPATVGVAVLSYGTPLRDAGHLIRDMLREQGFPAAEPGAGDAEVFTILLRAVAAGGMQVGEFFSVFMKHVPAWKKQNKLQRSLVVLLNDWVDQTTPEGRAAVAATLRTVTREALNETS